MADARPELDRTAVIVLNWNKPEMTIECVESLMTMEGDYDIYVIDNGSDEVARNSLVREIEARGACLLTEDELDGWDPGPNIPRLTLILLKQNYGYAKGNNFGLRLAYRLGYKYSLVSNNDIKVVDKLVLASLLEAISSDENVAWAAPVVLTPSGEVEGLNERENFWVYYFAGGIFYPFFVLPKKALTLFLRRSASMPSESLRMNVWPTGAFVMFKLSALAEVGFFDEHTFMYVEEQIILEKFRHKGYFFKYVSNARVLHLGAATTRTLKSEVWGFKMSLESHNYYFTEYRGYSTLLCKIASWSRWFRFWVYFAPIFLVKLSWRFALKGIRRCVGHRGVCVGC